MNLNNNPNYHVQSIERAMQILNSFSSDKRELGITELSNNLKLHKSTVHRILKTLESGGFIKRSKNTKRFRLGVKLFELGCIVQNQMDVREYALPVMQELAKKTQESIDLNIIIDDKRVSIEKIESPHDIRKIIQLGQSLPLYAGGSGKALLAFLPDSDIERIIKEEKIKKLGPKTILDYNELKKHLKKIKKDGYAASFEERIAGSASIAAPIFDYSGKVIASLSISGPISRFTNMRANHFITLIKDSTKKISILMGYQTK